MMWYEAVPAESKNRRGECSIRRFLRENVFVLVLLKVGGVRGQTVVSSPMRPGSTGPVMKAGVRSAVVKQATMVLDDV